jgi:Major Facilitator Superfamily
VPVAAPPRSATSLGRPFAWLWTAYAVSTFGTWVAFDAFPIIAITQLHAGPAAVSALAAAGLAVAALVAVPLGPWVERRRKRRVMVAMDLVRCGALLTVPLAYALGWLTFAQLVVVSVVAGAADIAFRAASGAYLKGLVEREELLVANARFESTAWTATALGPPLGGAAIGALGAVTTVIANAVSFAGSALALRASGRAGQDEDEVPAAPAAGRLRAADLLEGWRVILRDDDLRTLFFNNTLVSALILAPGPALAVLMLGELGFAPWQYALAFGAPCVGGLAGARLSRRALARLGERRLLLVFGTLRACWPIGLALVTAGAGGLALVFALQLGLVTCMGVFNPVLATVRLERTPDDRVARMLAAWNVSSNAARAALIALWGVLAAATSARAAVAAAGGLLLLTPLLLGRYRAAK